MTSEAKERPNFNIIEGYTVEVDYEEFKDEIDEEDIIKVYKTY